MGVARAACCSSSRCLLAGAHIRTPEYNSTFGLAMEMEPSAHLIASLANAPRRGQGLRWQIEFILF